MYGTAVQFQSGPCVEPLALHICPSLSLGAKALKIQTNLNQTNLNQTNLNQTNLNETNLNQTNFNQLPRGPQRTKGRSVT